MFSRAAFIVITLFWLTMNVLLWRAEFGANSGGNTLPAALVWQKIMTAPDSSSLIIIHHGKRIGVCHWATSVGEELSDLSEETIPSGTPEKIREYRLRLDGNALLTDSQNRLRFEGSLVLDQDRAWRELDVRLGLRPFKLRIQATAEGKSVHLKAETDGVQFEREFKFSDLQNPGALLRDLPGPLAGQLLDELDLPFPHHPDSAQASGATPAMNWEARDDDLNVGHTPVHVYRLQTRLLDRYSIVFFVSRVGEILRVELPDELELTNDQITPL